METVLLATDGSDHGRLAAERAIEVANDNEAALHVLCVVDRRIHGESGLSTEELRTIEAEDTAHDCVSAVTDLAAERGPDLSVEGEVKHGVPADLILEYAGEVDADLIVVGEHGDHREHLGGVGRTLVQDSSYDVSVVTLEDS